MITRESFEAWRRQQAELVDDDDQPMIDPDPMTAMVNRNHLSAVRHAEQLITKRSKQIEQARQIGELYEQFGEEGAESLLRRVEAEGQPAPQMPKRGSREWFTLRGEGLAMKRQARLAAERTGVAAGTGRQVGQQIEVNGRTLTYMGKRMQLEGEAADPQAGRDKWVYDDTGVEVDQATVQNMLKQKAGEAMGRSLRDIKAERLALDAQHQLPRVLVSKKDEGRMMPLGGADSGMFVDPRTKEVYNFRPALEEAGAINQPQRKITNVGGTVFEVETDARGNQTIRRSDVQPRAVRHDRVTVRNSDGTTSEMPILIDEETGEATPVRLGDLELDRKEGKLRDLVVSDGKGGYLPVRTTADGGFEVVTDAKGRPVYTPEQARLAKGGTETTSFRTVTVLPKNEALGIQEVKVTALYAAAKDDAGRVAFRVYYSPQDVQRITRQVAAMGEESAKLQERIDADTKSLNDMPDLAPEDKVGAARKSELESNIEAAKSRKQVVDSMKASLNDWVESARPPAEPEAETPAEPAAPPAPPSKPSAPTEKTGKKTLPDLTDSELAAVVARVKSGEIVDRAQIDAIRRELLRRKAAKGTK